MRRNCLILAIGISGQINLATLEIIFFNIFRDLSLKKLKLYNKTLGYSSNQISFITSHSAHSQFYLNLAQ